LSRSSLHASSLKLFSPSCFWNSLESMTKWNAVEICLEKNKHNHLWTPDFVWISSYHESLNMYVSYQTSDLVLHKFMWSLRVLVLRVCPSMWINWWIT
jgi:hypothetical protein